MELRHLRYFVAVAQEQNVTRAAARLHVSQPPLTRQIHDLEQELGVPLFARTGKSIRLTEAGRIFLKEARTCLARVSEAVDRVRAHAGAGGVLHLGYAPSPTTEILPKLLRIFGSKQPLVRVRLHDHSSPEILSGLQKRRLHAAIMMEPATKPLRGLRFEPFRSYPVGVAVPPGHRLSRFRSIGANEILREPLVVYSRAEYPDYHKFLRRSLGSKAKRAGVVHECDSGPSLIAAVAAGRGICVCSSIFATVAGKRLIFRPIVPAPPPAVVGIAYLERSLDAASRALLDSARSLATISG